MMEKLDLKTKVGMIYAEVMFLVAIIVEEFCKLNVGLFIAIIAAIIASMYAVDRIALKKGCALRKKYQK